MGNDSVSAWSSISYSVNLFCSMNCARSSTTLDDSVTSTVSPSKRLAVAFARLMKRHWLVRPTCVDWNSEFVNYPFDIVVISWWSDRVLSHVERVVHAAHGLPEIVDVMISSGSAILSYLEPLSASTADLATVATSCVMVVELANQVAGALSTACES